MSEEDTLSKETFQQRFEAEKCLLGEQVMEQFDWVRANFPLFRNGQFEEGMPASPNGKDVQDKFGYFWGIYAHQLPGIEWALVVALHVNAPPHNENCYAEHLFIPIVKIIAWRWEKESWDSLLLDNDQRNQEYYDIFHNENAWEFHIRPGIGPGGLPHYDCVEELEGYAAHGGDPRWIEIQLRRLMLKVMAKVEQSVSR